MQSDLRPRRFAWVRPRISKFKPIEPQILFHDEAGPKMEVVASVLLKDSEYDLTIEQLAQRYPAPEMAWD